VLQPSIATPRAERHKRQFQTLRGTSFVVNGARQTVADRSAEMKWINGWPTAATFEGEFSNVTRSYAKGRGAICLLTSRLPLLARGCPSLRKLRGSAFEGEPNSAIRLGRGSL